MKNRTFRIRDKKGEVIVELTGPSKHGETNIMHYALKVLERDKVPVIVEEFVKASWRNFIKVAYSED